MQNRIKEWRVARGLTQEQLAEMVEAHFTTINRLENKKQGLSQKWIEKLSRVLEVHPSELLGSDVVRNTREDCGLEEEAALYQPDPKHWLSQIKLENNQALYRITSDALSALGIQANSVALIDFNADAVADALRSQEPSLVLAQHHYDPNEFMHCLTLPRQLIPPHTLIRNSLDKRSDPLTIGDGRTDVVAVIKSIMRDVGRAET